MNVVIEAEVATSMVHSVTARVFALSKYAGECSPLFLVRPSASIITLFFQGSTSRSAVSPDNYFNEGGLAVA